MSGFEQRWSRVELQSANAFITEHHTILVRYDSDGYVQIHEDSLGPLLKAAGYYLSDVKDLATHAPSTS